LPIDVLWASGARKAAISFTTLYISLMVFVGILLAVQPAHGYGTHFWVGLSLLGGLVVLMIFWRMRAQRAYRVVLWRDRIVYHHVWGSVTVPRDRILSAGYFVPDLASFPLWCRALVAYTGRKNQPRLGVNMDDGSVVWFSEFVTAPAGVNSLRAARSRRTSDEVAASLQRYLRQSN
jgi:hypothetical protein